jgi:lysyl-tRNA synthetase class 1
MSTVPALPDIPTSWPFQEATKLQDRSHEKGYILFETGYGPSGLPHLGTFGEVLRTSMVRKAFETVCPGIATKLIAFSDDMDGLRKVPGNVPNQDLLAQHLHKPLTKVPDPFAIYPSFGEHNNAKLCSFLDAFGFNYDFRSATECYKTGVFDETLLNVLHHYDAIMAVMLPTLGKDRQETYSPFLPICPATGKVLQAAVTARDTGKGTITYTDPDTGKSIEVPVTGGACKLQWKVDLAMRWVTLGVDYEMAGKDLTDSLKLSDKICRILGGTPPVHLIYELFLDDKGEKISKSKGNGLSLEDWLRYAPQESLAYYLFLTPTRAKKLYFDVIPKAADEYLTFLGKYPGQTPVQQHDNPVWHIHGGTPPRLDADISFSLLLNLAAACNAEDATILWGFIRRSNPSITPKDAPFLDHLVGFAVRYYHDFVRAKKTYRPATTLEAAAMKDMKERLLASTARDAESLQTLVYTVGTEHGFTNLRDWFGALYAVLLGQETGPRMGSFIALFGVDAFCTLIDEKL